MICNHEGAFRTSFDRVCTRYGFMKCVDMDWQGWCSCAPEMAFSGERKRLRCPRHLVQLLGNLHRFLFFIPAVLVPNGFAEHLTNDSLKHEARPAR